MALAEIPVDTVNANESSLLLVVERSKARVILGDLEWRIVLSQTVPVSAREPLCPLLFGCQGMDGAGRREGDAQS